MLRRLTRGIVAVRDFLLSIAVLLVAWPLWFLPARAAIGLGGIGGVIGSWLWGEARRAGMINLKRAYPQLSLTDARARVERVFVNMGRSIAEGIQFSRRDGEGAEAGRIYVHEDPELALRIHADQRPKIFVTAHLGSWEVALMIARSVIGGNGAVIARGVDNPLLNAVVRRIRFRDPSEWIEKRGAIPEAVRRLRGGHSVAMLIDENGGPRGPHVDFFGRRASTRKTPALLSLMTGAPIVVGAAVRRKNAPLLFRLAVLDSSGPADDSKIVETTAGINCILERWIREDPEQWRWLHWRWRTRPDGTSETYTRRDLRSCFAGEPALRASADARSES